MNNISHKLAKYNKKMISYTKNGKNVDKIAKKQQKYMNMVGGAPAILEEIPFVDGFFQSRNENNSCGRKALNNFLGGIYFTTNLTEQQDIKSYNETHELNGDAAHKVVDVYTDENVFLETTRPYNLKKLCVYISIKNKEFCVRGDDHDEHFDCNSHGQDELYFFSLLQAGMAMYGYKMEGYSYDINDKQILGYVFGSGAHYWSYRKVKHGWYKFDSYNTNKQFLTEDQFKKEREETRPNVLKFKIYFSGELPSFLNSERETGQDEERFKIALANSLNTHEEQGLLQSATKLITIKPEISSEQIKTQFYVRDHSASEVESQIHVESELPDETSQSHSSQTEQPIQHQTTSHESNLCTTDQILQKIRPLKEKLKASKKNLSETQDELKTLKQIESRGKDTENATNMIAYKKKLLGEFGKTWNYKDEYTEMPQTIQNAIDCKIQDPDSTTQFEKKYLKYKSKYLYLKNEASKNI